MPNEVVGLRALRDNYIWVLVDPLTRSVMVVDPGDAAPVLDFLQQQALTLSGIFLTHHHWDHTNGVEKLLSVYPDCLIYASEQSPCLYVNQPVSANSVILFAGFTFRVLDIPGHTLDHLAYFGEKKREKILFCGDTVFSAGCGRIFEGTPEMFYASLQKILLLPDETKLYCGHEYTLANLHFAHKIEPENDFISNKIKEINQLKNQSTTGEVCTLPSRLSEERFMNPFFRCHLVSIKKTVEQHANKRLDNAVDVFRELRAWKNNS